MKIKRTIALALALVCTVSFGMISGTSALAGDPVTVTAGNDSISVYNTVIEIPGLTREYKFLQVSDTHLSLPMTDTTNPYYQAMIDRNTHFTALAGGVSPTVTFPKFFSVAESENYDAVIMTGDILDSPSTETLDFFYDTLDNTTMDYLYTAGNHDWTWDANNYFTTENRTVYKPMLDTACAGRVNGAATTCNKYGGYIDYGEFVIVMLENSEDKYPTKAYQILYTALALNKPTLVFMHVPVDAETLTPAIYEHTGGANPGNYTIGPHRGTTLFEVITEEIYKLLKNPDNNIVGVFASHLHFEHEDLICEGRYQYITPGGYEGKARLITIKGTGCTTHTWDTGTQTTAPTATTEGVMTYTCTVCGETRTEAIDPLGYSKGDVDGDGKVNSSDIISLRLHVSGSLDITDPFMLTAADLDMDEKVNSSDIISLRLLITA